MAIGKTASNGTLNADGAFYSVQDVNVLLENAGGGGGADLPTPTVADAGSVVVVDNEGKYALGEAGGGGFKVQILRDAGTQSGYLNKNYNEINSAIENGYIVCAVDTNAPTTSIYYLGMIGINQDKYAVLFGDTLYISDSATGTLTESSMG